MPPILHRRTFPRLALALWLVCAFGHAAADERRVLVLYSLGADSSSAWQRLVHKGMYDELERSSQGTTPAIFEERFDANRVGEEKLQEGMAPYLETKYADVKFDAIVTENFVAARFLSSHPELFPGVPRHYVNHGRDQWMPRDGMGYEVSSDFERAIGVIPLVDPDVRHIVVIGDQTMRGQMWLERIRKITPRFPGIRFEIWDDGSVTELRQRAAVLDQGSAIFMLSSIRGEGWTRIQPQDLARQIASATRAPLFTHSESLVIPGVVGGYVVSGEAVGRVMARLLLGQPALAGQLQGYYFDYPTARQAGLRNIPHDAVMLNRPHNVWELYRWQIISVGALILLEGALITALVLSLRARRRAMADLASERNGLEDRVLQRTLELLQANRKLQEQASTDPLTGIANRRKMTEQIAQELERARRFRHPLSLLMIDIDHFKRINDSHGHEVGDQAIVQTATLLTANLRAVDSVARFGGEEFVLLLPETPVAVAAYVAERLREQAAQLRVRTELGDEVALTISIGVAAADPYGAPDTPSSLLVRSDKALYRAKKEGRNRVVQF
ncbi:GGDEF domain-containing protein [Pseudoduganella violaceinigra]|uniref:GGDEF domain-containing protein n=1 Tax=Pseudoduganella violaceinigra TaxID=246602 RepID=UPI00041A1BB5|nr:GGDEF domain-containing protein [Pseudoduganella violaceinigra]